MTTAISTITPEQLHAAQLCGHRPALLDVRTAAEYRAGHIPAAPVEYSMQRNHADPTLCEQEQGSPRQINQRSNVK